MGRLSNRLLDAGAEPAGHASKLARVLGTTVQSNGTRLPEDPVQRAVAEQVDELLVWDRAVRADADDSVHQMRVTTRKIRSLLKDAQESLGVSEGPTHGCSTNYANSPAFWGWPATPRCSKSATSKSSIGCHRNWCAARCGNA